MKRLSHILAAVAAAIVVCSSFCVFAADIQPLTADTMISSINDYDSFRDEYTIDAYDIDIVVGEDNTLTVCERITANFNIPKHGIYRYIPIRGSVKREDGSSADYHARVSKVSSAPLYDKYKDGSNYVIQLGEEDVTLTGKNDYEIRYTYSMGKDLLGDGDEFYYNLVGNGWDTTLDNVTFSITMPRDFDASKIGFSTGGYGAVGTNIVEFDVDGNVITGRLTKTLQAHEGLTARIELEDGYFTFNALAYYSRYFAQIGISFIALAAVIVLWAKYGKDKKIVDVVEFYPPENMNSAEMSYYHNGMVKKTDTVAMIIELANEGYLKIEDCTPDKESFRLIKIKNYDGGDKLKHKFFNGLFKSGDNVCEDDLKEKFYPVIEYIVNQIYIKERGNVFNRKSLILRVVGWVISLAAVFANIAIFSVTNYGTTQDVILLAVGVGIAVAAFIFSFFIRKRTDRGHEIKQRIDGFKTFLETAEKEKLEALVDENPSYFYDILPYAYVLGVSDKWTKKFESIAMEPPRWYYSSHHTVWDYMIFNSFMRSTMHSAAETMISTPTNTASGGNFSGGSFGGGGGFSGGGFGGGGGGSW